MSSQHNGIKPETVETIAGLTAGLASTIIVHPLDIIKTRLQLDTTTHPFLNSSRTVFREILRNEGPTRIAALYRGLTPNLIGNSAGWGLYFLWYKQAQDLVVDWRGYGSHKELTSGDYLVTSAGAGAMSALLTNPIWVVKTRMIATSATTQGAYPSMWSGIKSIWQIEGMRGYFHGLVPAMLNVSHGALYFLAYENLKRYRREQRGSDVMSNTDSIVISAISKVFAGTLTYPTQVIRARLQTYDPSAKVARRSPGIVGVTISLWRYEGFVGFYKGLGPNLVRAVPSTCVTFLVYENVRWALPRFFNHQERTISNSI